MEVLTDCHIIWLDEKEFDDYSDFGINLQSDVSHSLYSFTDRSLMELFIEYKLNTKGLLLFFVYQKYFDESFRSWLKQLSPNLTVFVYILSTKYLFEWRTMPQIRYVFHRDDEEIIIKNLKSDLNNYLAQQWSSGVCLFNDNSRQIALDQISDDHAQLMWFQLLIKVFLRMPSTAQSKNDLLEQSFLVYFENVSQQKLIRDFHHRYQTKEAIQYYTGAGFVYRLFNQACRTDNIDLLFSFRFFLRDLYAQLAELHRQQVQNGHLNCIKRVYRSAIISKEEIQMLNKKTNEKKLIWFKSFVSTSRDSIVAKKYLDENPGIDEEAVLQEIHLHHSGHLSRVPFADIEHLSRIPDEREILLGIGMVFEVKSVMKEPGGRFWNMTLEMVDYDDRIRQDLRVWLEEEVSEETSAITLSRFLQYIGDYKKAIKYNELFLKELFTSDSDKALVYNNLGNSYQKMNQSSEALKYLNASIDLYEKMEVKENRTSFYQKLAVPYNNKGLVYRNLGEYPLALENIQKSFDLRADDPTLPEQERRKLAIERSFSLENLSLVYKDMSEYQLALSYELKVKAIREENLPSNHFLLSQCYNNLGHLLLQLKDCSKAFELLNQALIIQTKCLPDDHPHLSIMYNNLGLIYSEHVCYDLALVNFEKALHISRKALVRNSVIEAVVLSNIASVLRNQNKYDQALTSFIKALPIFQRLKPHHPDLARALTNVGLVYRDKEDFSMALTYFQQALKFSQTHLGENHEMTAGSYLSVASVLPVNDGDLAIDYLKRVIDIYYRRGLPKHTHVMQSYQQLGDCYRRKHEHTRALQFYNQAVSLAHETELAHHNPYWIVLHVDIVLEYLSLNDYNHAVEEYEKALGHVTQESSKSSQIQQNLNLGRQRILEYEVYWTINEIIQSIEEQSSMFDQQQ